MPNIGTNAAAPGDQYRAAIDTYRTTLKWVLSSFAAVAAALIVGVQLTSLGALHGQRLALALIAAGAAFAGVFGIILLAVRALAPVGGTRAEFAASRKFKPLRDYLARDQSPLRRMANSAEELAARLEEARTTEIEAKAQHDKNPTDPALRQAFENAKRDRETLAPVVDTVTRFGIYLRVQELFGQAMRAVSIGVPLAAAGALAYAYLANPPKPPPPGASVDCAAYYLELDSLADDDPALAPWFRSLRGSAAADARAQACGFHTNADLAGFVDRLGPQ